MKQRMGTMLFVLFSIGTAVGILAAFVLRDYFLEEFDGMQAGMLQSLEEQLYSRVELFFFLLWQRIKQTLFLLCMFMTAIGLPFLYGTAMVTGAVFGCYLFLCCCQYGISGTAVCLMGFFPHGFCYLFLLFLLIHQCFGNIVYESVGSEKTRTRYQGKGVRRKLALNSMFRLLLGTILLLLGCFAEACFHPPMLCWILQLAS